MIAQGSKRAFELLFCKFQGLIYKRVFEFTKKYNIPQMYHDDLTSEATDALVTAVRRYIYSPDSTFISFWWSIVEHKFVSFLRRIADTKVFYFDPGFLENEVMYLSDYDLREPSMLTIDIVLEICRRAKIELNNDETRMLKLFIEGYKTSELPDIFSWTKTKVYRIRKKLMEKLNKINNLI